MEKASTTESTKELTLRFDTDVLETREWFAKELFEADGARLLLAEVSERTQAQLAEAAPDLTTDKGRKELASIAYLPRRIRSAIAKAKGEYTQEIRDHLSRVNAAANTLDTGLDALAKELRAPLDEIEKAEAAEAQRRADAERERVAKIDAAINELTALRSHPPGMSVGALRGLTEQARALIPLDAATYQEKLPWAERILAESISSLERDLELAERRETDAKREAEEAERRAQEEAARKRNAEIDSALRAIRNIVLAPDAEIEEWHDAEERLENLVDSYPDELFGDRLAEVQAECKAAMGRIAAGMVAARKRRQQEEELARLRQAEALREEFDGWAVAVTEVSRKGTADETQELIDQLYDFCLRTDKCGSPSVDAVDKLQSWIRSLSSMRDQRREQEAVAEEEAVPAPALSCDCGSGWRCEVHPDGEYAIEVDPFIKPLPAAVQHRANRHAVGWIRAHNLRPALWRSLQDQFLLFAGEILATDAPDTKE
jgi:hypothetical protein